MKGYKYVKDASDALNDRMSLYSSTTKVSLSGIKSLRRTFDASTLIMETEDPHPIKCEYLRSKDGYFIDSQGRKVILKGINVDGASKLPVSPSLPTYKGNANDADDIFFDGDNVSFVGRPFGIDEAELHFQRIKSWGYNTIRYIITWEAIEHKGPGKYDDDFIDYTNEILKIIHRVGGLYVFIDVHQDVWSRFSGGSGAPMWTLYAAGLQPKRFAITQAAILHNEERYQIPGESELYPDSFPKMIWPTNYKRLASLVMFTLFFSGKNYFSKYKINNQNIQVYLQSHFFSSIEYFWKKVVKANQNMIEDGTLLGFETMNEPNCGLIGHPHLGYLPDNQQLRVGTTPTVYQTFKLGMGIPCEVDNYKISIAGPQKSGTEIVDPKGARAWMTPQEAEVIDKHYNWKRSDNWIIGECLFLQVGVWSYETLDFKTFGELPVTERLLEATKYCGLLLPNFFNQFLEKHSFKMYSGVKPSKIDMEFFINNNFVSYVLKFKKIIRSAAPSVFFMLQPPVLEKPPNLKTDPRNIIDHRTVYCPHYYDGLSLMFKTWNFRYNVDTLGIMRGRYINPVLGIVFGERAIRNCLRKQFNEINRECQEYLGNIPVLMSETGMPFDMDNKKAYKDGRYLSQTYALDALTYALEGLNMSHTYWCYTSTNCHKYGDRWNNEDFSFWSLDDRNLKFDESNGLSDLLGSTISTTMSLLRNARSKRINHKVKSIKSKLKKDQLNVDDITDQIHELDVESKVSEGEEEEYDDDDDDDDDSKSLQDSSLICWTADNVRYRHTKRCFPSPDGVRATNAIIRPYVMASVGDIIASEFDLRTVKFSLTISIPKGDKSSVPSIIHVPNWHYPNLCYNDIYLTSGFVKYNREESYLEWYLHDPQNDGSEVSTLVNDSLYKQETIIIKNNSGTLDSIRDEKPKSNATCIIM